MLSEYYHHKTPQQAEALLEALQRVPEAVVRCKDCVHCADDYIDTGLGLMPCFTCELFEGYGANIEPGHFCSYGEEGTNETN